MSGSMSITGLASGLDIDAIIEASLEQYRLPITRLQEKKNDYQLMKDAWRDINTRLSALQTKAEDLLEDSVFTKKKATSSLEDYVSVSADDTATPATYEVQVTHLARAHRIASDQYADIDADLTLTGTLTINGTDITVEDTDSLADIRDKINSASFGDGQGVEASIVDGHLVLEASETGVASTIDITDPDSIATSLGLLDGLGGYKSELQQAQDAQFTVNGLTITRSANTIDDVVDGVTFTLQQETNGETAVLEISEDVEHTISKLQALVDQYNSFTDFAGSKLEKEALLQGDGTLIRLQMSLRRQVTDPVELGSDYDQLAVIGIETDRSGMLSLDQATFREALADHPTEVKALVQEVAGRISDHLETYVDSIDGVIPNRQEMFDRQIEDIEDQIERVEERVARKEEQLVLKYTELEKALNDLQSQGMWLSSQVASLSMMGGKK